ncbi:hypothetical protein [Ekhidna sp.]
MKKYIKKSKNIQIAIVALGLLVSGVIMVQGINHNQETVANKSSLESFKNTIKENKSLIVNSYLLGVSIFKETSD